MNLIYKNGKSSKKVLESKFEKNISKFSCLMIGIGGLIGGGIFSVIGAISEYTGPYSYISYIITGLIALITVYSYSKLNNVWPSPGGEYTIIRNAFTGEKFKALGPIVGLLLYFGYIVTVALYAYTFSIYFLYLFGIPVNYLFVMIIIISLISFFTIINLFNIKDSTYLENILVVTKIIILGLFIIFGMIYALTTPSQMITNLGLDFASFHNFNFIGIMIGSASIVVSYQGFQLIAHEVYEMKDKKGGLGMMKWSLIISMAIYIFVGITAISILGVSGVMGKDAHDSEVAIAIAATKFLTPFGAVIIIIGALFSTASAINATIIGSSRLAFMMGSEKLLPLSLSKLNSKHEPIVSIIIVGLFSILIAMISGGALAIAGVAGLLFSQIYFFVNFTNYHVRKKTKSRKIFPIIGMITTATLFIILLIYSLLNIITEFFSLIVFIVIECITLLFVILKLDLHLSHMNSLEKGLRPES
ncbi:MAG: APC family permease [Promethearchaeota archaeon]